MAEELAPPPTRSRRIGAALAGLGVYVLMMVTSWVLPSVVGNLSILIGFVAGTLVAGGLTPALTIRDWVIAGALTLALVAITHVILFAIIVVYFVSMFTPDMAAVALSIAIRP